MGGEKGRHSEGTRGRTREAAAPAGLSHQHYGSRGGAVVSVKERELKGVQP